MKLQLDEIVEHPDADLVLRKLERDFGEVSLEAVRAGDELIVTGLGPSFRTMNPRDKTVVRAAAQPAATMLHIEANFLASALVGDVPQDDIVRSKIARALESLRSELNIDAAAHRPAFETLPTAEPISPSPTAAVAPVIATIAEAAPLAPVETKEISPSPIDPAPESTKLPPVEPELKSEPKLKLDPALKSEPEPKKEEPVLAAPRRSAPVPSPAPLPSMLKPEATPVGKRRSAFLLLLPLFVLLLAVAGYFLHRSRSSQEFLASTQAAQTADSPAENNAVAPAPPSPPASAASGQTAPAAMPKDINAWVQAWAAAISTHDVQQQLSFYATPLDRYFLAPNVSREQLLKDKQAEIDGRKGVWTLKAEDVVVQKETATNAVVVLIKHITAELPSSSVKEERIKAQLKLKLVDGSWKITSERTIA